METSGRLLGLSWMTDFRQCHVELSPQSKKISNHLKHVVRRGAPQESYSPRGHPDFRDMLAVYRIHFRKTYTTVSDTDGGFLAELELSCWRYILAIKAIYHL